jgi:uncharacterized damage-inducible protein DinB
MSPDQALLSEFEQEFATTRRTLERVPEARIGWRPHAKSWTLGELATHLASIPDWAVQTIQEDELSIDGARPPEAVRSKEELLRRFDTHMADARGAFGELDGDALRAPWSLVREGRALMTLPRGIVLRSFVLSHNVHHRAQLGVYLRLLDVPLPSTYGPTADEPGM